MPAISAGALAVAGAILVALAGGWCALGLIRLLGRRERLRAHTVDGYRHPVGAASTPPDPTEVSATVLSLRYLHEGIRQAAPTAPSAARTGDFDNVHKVASDLETALDSLVSISGVHAARAVPR
jgi:hypothetical protein